MSVVELSVAEIISEKDFMIRDELDKKLVETYAENIDQILNVAPIEVWDTPGGKYLADGFHRYSAAISCGHETVPCIVKIGSVEEALAAACVANIKHGKPLSRQERQNAINQYIKIYWDHSNVWLAMDLGVSDETIRRYREKLVVDESLELPEKILGQDGIWQPFQGSTIVEPETQTVSITYEEFKEKQLVLAIEKWDEDFAEKVMLGDAFEILPTLEDKSFDLILVDPPYGITTEKWDLKNKSDLIGFTREWLVQVRRILKSSGRMFVCWSRKYMFELKPIFDEVFEHYPLNFGGMIVWHWRNSGSQPDNRKRYKLSWEPVFYFYGTEASDLDWTETDISGKAWKGRGYEQSDVWAAEDWTVDKTEKLWKTDLPDDVFVHSIPQSNFKDKKIHPTQKPLTLYEHIIRTASSAGQKVLDPFAGSGTAAHACMLTGRDFLLIEKEPEYYELIHDRLKGIWTSSNEFIDIEKNIKKQWDEQVKSGGDLSE